ncbi:neogenin, partial [Hyalella azteca]|uniref:Neogenin n=1 Tax=Hyalella azteca TaxID=294128 RepID=A0A979FQ44_HYAAZ
MAHPCLHVRKSPSRPGPLPLMGPGIPNETFLHKSNNFCDTVTVKRKKAFNSLNGMNKPKRYYRRDEPKDRSLGVPRTFGLFGDNESREGLLMKQERRRSLSSVHTSSSCHHESSLNVIYYNKAGVSMACLLLFVLLLAAAAAAQGVYLRQQPQALTVRKGAPAWLHCRASLSPGPGPTRGPGPHGDDEDFFDPLLEDEDPEYPLQEGDDPHHPLQEGDDEAGITYQWLKDGQLLPPDARRRVLGNGTLILEAVSSSRQELTDEGSYQCQATSAAGTVLSVPARLSIARILTDGLSKFTRGPEDMQAYEGEKAYFACSLGGSDLPHAGGDEGLTVSWHRDDAPLLLDSRMTVLPSGSLEISNLQLADAATYHCHVSHMGKTKVSDVARLTVTPGGARRPPSRPSFIARPASQVVAAGASVSLDCAANGHPPPAVQWLKDGATLDLQDLDSRAVLVGPTWGLQLREARESDAGAYMCRASNGLDSEDAVAHLSVRVPPHVVTGPPAVVVAREREDALVRCTITGVPRPLVAWYKNAELITPSEYFQQVPDEGLKILGVVQGDAGMYQCFGTSVAGTVQATTRLLVHPAGTADNNSDNNDSDDNSNINSVAAADVDSSNRSGKASNNSSVPGAPREVRALSTSNRHLTLTWRPPLLGASYVTRYIVTYRSVQSPSLLLKNGGVEVTRWNCPSHLVGPASPPLEVSTRPDLDLPTAPTNLTVTPTSPTALLVTWAPPAPVGHDSPLTAYKLMTMGVNRHGEGDAPREEVGRTYSAAPTSPPSNPRLEPASSRSLILRWEPPPLEHQNGVITGPSSPDKPTCCHTTHTHPFNTPTHPNTGTSPFPKWVSRPPHPSSTLQHNLMSALTVNGSGPWTPWLYGQTYASDLDETTVPGTPTGLVANAKSSSVSVRWEAPSSPGGGALVRGYTVGWGRGIPDVYTKIVDATKRRYTIEHLEDKPVYEQVRGDGQPVYEQVRGDGQPVYEQVNTRPPDPDPPHRLRTPLALKAEVMTAYSVALSWTDTALNDNQFVGDRGYYTVRYTSYASASSSSPRYKYMNVSDVTCLIDNLKPATMYEFTVKAVRGNRDSRWSLVATNTTLEAKPSSPPRDVTVVTIRNQPSTVVVNWQPPRHANGRITGYLILYTTDPSLPWGVEQVEGDRLSHTLTPLTPHTTYHYKLQARNAKGHSPFTPVANFTTLMAAAATAPDGGSLFSGWSSVVVVAVVVAVV